MLNPLHFAVVVGISTYPGGFTQLQGPVNDAREFARWLKNPSGGGLPAANVRLIVSPRTSRMTLAEAKPLKNMIDDALWALVKAARAAVAALPEEERSSARRSARLYLMVAGHGIMPGGGQAALLDARAEPDRRTNMELSTYSNWFLQDGTFGEICIFADCCRTFELLADPGGPDLDRVGSPGGDVHPVLGWATGVGRLSFEDVDPTVPPDERRGYFSRALLDGLAGNATDPATGYVTAELLGKWVENAVVARTGSKPAHLRQKSFMLSNPAHVMTFGPPRTVMATAAVGGPAAVPGRELRKVRIAFPPGFYGLVDLVAPDRATTRWDAADGTWTVWLYDALWVVQHAGTGLDTTNFAGDGAFTVIGEDRDVQL